MRTLSSPRVAVLLVPYLCWAPFAAADYRNDVGLDRLIASAGALPSGAGIALVQVEAPSAGAYFPDTTRAELAHVTFTDQSGGAAGGISGHATSMALRLAGTSNSSLTPGVDRIAVFEAGDWLSRILATGTSSAPQSPSGAVFNHSWVAAFQDVARSGEALARLDWLIQGSSRPHVVGVAPDQPLQNQAFNVIAADSTKAARTLETQTIDAAYGAGRAVVHLVVPVPNSSTATAVVSSAITLLAAERASRDLTAHPGMLVKAILMASAARAVENSDGSTMTDFGSGASGLRANGLDPRFGAGQLDIAAAHAISIASTQPSLQDGGDAIAARGHHLDTAFGGPGGSNTAADYPFEIRGDGSVSASLVWQASVRDALNGPGFAPQVSLENLDLSLLRVEANGSTTELARSASNIDNTEHVLDRPLAPGVYRLRVTPRNGQTSVSMAYALAWAIDDTLPVAPVAVPLFSGPASVGLALTAIGGIAVRGQVRAKRRRNPRL